MNVDGIAVAAEPPRDAVPLRPLAAADDDDGDDVENVERQHVNGHLQQPPPETVYDDRA